MSMLPYRGFLKLGVPFGGPHNKDYSILGSILGSPILGNYHMSYSPNSFSLSGVL